MAESSPLKPASLVPSRRWISMIVLYLRLAVGLPVLRIGINSYLLRAGSGGPSRVSFQLLPGNSPAFLLDLFQYLCIILGVAVVLGFFTKVAALGVASLQAGATLIQIVMELKAGQAGNVFATLPSSQLLAIQLLPLLWFSGVATNLYSLDGLMLVHKQTANKPRSKAAPASPVLTGGSTARHDPETLETAVPIESKAWVPRDLDFNDPEFGVVAEKPQDAV